MDKLDIIIDIQTTYIRSMNQNITNFKKDCLEVAKKYCLDDSEFFEIARGRASLERMREILNNTNRLHEGDII